MKKENTILWVLVVLSAVLMSVPFLVPGAGPLALIGFVPLLCMERIADLSGTKRVWIYHYSTFVLWNAITTFWVCNATVGGGLFAIFANALQMSVVFGLFRFSKKRFTGALPYIFLAAAWIAWERFYFDTDISWPWLVLGNAFGRSTWAVQWYEYTGCLGGSLWIWASNLAVFGVMIALSEGRWNYLNIKAKTAIFVGLGFLFIFPFVISPIIGNKYDGAMEEGDKLPVLIIQPNIDPYHKFQALSQDEQNAILLTMAEENLRDRLNDTTAEPLLVVAPETFTSDIVTHDFSRSWTWRRITSFLSNFPNVNMLFGASSFEYTHSSIAPTDCSRKVRDGLWVDSHNSALMVDGSGRSEIFHKSKLVVAVEMTPYPKFFCPIDDALGGVMGRCVGQEEINLLHVVGRFPDGAGNDGYHEGRFPDDAGNDECTAIREECNAGNDGYHEGRFPDDAGNDGCCMPAESAGNDGYHEGRFPDGAGNDECTAIREECNAGNDGCCMPAESAGNDVHIPIGCAICYESVYGEYFTDYIRKGAKAMTVITNDAWWGDTPGYKQHLSYSCLRAIETRRAIARCANTGISAIISPSGEVVEQTQWWKPAVIKSEIPMRNDITFFVAHGDIIGRLCNFLFWLLLAALAVKIGTGSKAR